MKRTASARRNSSASGTSTSRKGAKKPTFAVCVRNEGYEASLERNKIYAVLADEDARRDGDLRVIDESGEDYLFPAEYFQLLTLPAGAERIFRRRPVSSLPRPRRTASKTRR